MEWGKCRADTRGWRAQCFSRTPLGIGCEAWVLRPVRLPPPPSRAIQTDHPSAPHVQDISRAATQAKRATADAEAPRGVWAHTVLRPPIGAELRGASFGEHRLLAALLQPALCQAEHMGRAAPPAVEPRPQQSSVRPARAPLAARAAVTVAATSAKSVGDSMSRTSRSPPTCTRATAPSPTI